MATPKGKSRKEKKKKKIEKLVPSNSPSTIKPPVHLFSWYNEAGSAGLGQTLPKALCKNGLLSK